MWGKGTVLGTYEKSFPFIKEKHQNFPYLIILQSLMLNVELVNNLSCRVIASLEWNIGLIIAMHPGITNNEFKGFTELRALSFNVSTSNIILTLFNYGNVIY